MKMSWSGSASVVSSTWNCTIVGALAATVIRTGFGSGSGTSA